MAFGKTVEQKAAEQAEREAKQAEREAQQAQERAEQAHREFLASPVGQATTAKEQRQGFFEIQLQVGSSQRDSTVWGGNNTHYSKTSVQSHAGTLAAIESIGWHLEHVGYVFVVTGESSRDKFMASGQQTAVSGITMGLYLFRNTD